MRHLGRVPTCQRENPLKSNIKPSRARFLPVPFFEVVYIQYKTKSYTYINVLLINAICHIHIIYFPILIEEVLKKEPRNRLIN